MIISKSPEFPYLQRIYGFYGAQDNVRNVHLPNERHDQSQSFYSFIQFTRIFKQVPDAVLR